MPSIAKTIKDQTDSILRRRQVAPGSSVTVRGGTTEPGTGAGTPPEIVDPNSGLAAHKASADHDGRYYTEAEVDALIADIPDGGVSAFTELSDVPDSYTGQQGKFTRVNSTEDGIEFASVAPGSGAASFVDLDDVPSSLAGQGGKVVAINAAGSALEFIDAPTGDGGGTPSGDGTEDIYTGALAGSGGSFSGTAMVFESLENIWVSAIKYYLGSATDNNVTINFRTYGSEMKAQKTGVVMNTGEWNTVIFDHPIYLKKNSYYVVEVLYSSAAKLYRTTSYLYSGTLWKLLQNRVNNFFGSAYSETVGFGLIEYADTP